MLHCSVIRGYNGVEATYVRPELSNVLHLMRKVRDTVAGESAVKASAECILRFPVIHDDGPDIYRFYPAVKNGIWVARTGFQKRP